MTTRATATERPILMSSPMVRALLSGRKTKTRRVAFKDDPDHHMPWWCAGTHWQDGDERLRCPYAVGMRLWVRETWCPKVGDDDCLIWSADGNSYAIHYRADGQDVIKVDGDGFEEYRRDGSCASPWRPSIFMPRWASRVTLEVTEVGVERLQSITEEDAIAEGLGKITKDDGRTWKYGIPDRDGLPGGCDVGWPWHDWDVDPRKAYARLWDEINGEKYPWVSNVWVWVLAFRRVDVDGPPVVVPAGNIRKPEGG